MQERHSGRGDDIDRDLVSECVETSSSGSLPERLSPEVRFAAVDTNDDGFIDRVEFDAAGVNRAADRFFATDASGDGAISAEELLAAITERTASRELFRACVEEQQALSDPLFG